MFTLCDKTRDSTKQLLDANKVMVAYPLVVQPSTNCLLREVSPR